MPTKNSLDHTASAVIPNASYNMELVSIEENIPENVLVTIIIPIRAKSMDSYLLTRIGYSLLDSEFPRDKFGVVLADEGSPSEISTQIRRECQKYGFGYIKLATQRRPFSAGRARNYAAMISKSKYIMIQDIDLMPTRGFYNQVLQEMKVQRLEENAKEFLMFGVIYLSEESTEEFFTVDPDIRRQLYTQALFEDDSSKVVKFSTGTSANVFNRQYYLARGGHDPEFEEWGFEDLEFNVRCILNLDKFPVPEDWSADVMNFSTINQYKGWKSSYRLMGDLTFMKGMTLFHAWHPVDRKSQYMQNRLQNQKLFQSKIKAYKRHRVEPDPLPDISCGRTLVFRDNAFVNNREFLPKLGETLLASENDFESFQDFKKTLEDNQITRVLFHNPYVNQKMIDIYRYCRQYKIEYIVAERGALPGSVFYDKNGFLADSDSYDPKNWDHELDSGERIKTQNFIRDVRCGNQYLELQSERLGANGARERLGISRYDKVLFVPLQRPNDTVVKHQAGEIQSFDSFISLVRNITSSLEEGWKVVVKAHPLEDETPDIPGAIFANNNNIDDLLDLSAKVLLINSGCGVFALLREKPVIVTGNSFYGYEGLVKRSTDPKEILDIIYSGWIPDREKILRYIHFLSHKFYSFGEFQTHVVSMSMGNKITSTKSIDFETIRGLPGGEIRAKPAIATGAKIDKRSILFDRYRGGKSYSKLAEGERQDGIGQSSPAPSSSFPAVIRKLKKLRRDPSRFINDSQIPMLKKLSK